MCVLVALRACCAIVPSQPAFPLRHVHVHPSRGDGIAARAHLRNHKQALLRAFTEPRPPRRWMPVAAALSRTGSLALVPLYWSRS